MRLLRIAVACLAVLWATSLKPVARCIDNAWRRATERHYRIPDGSRWWTFRAADRTDRDPGWTCAEDATRFFLRTDTGIRATLRSGLPPLADPCAPQEDPDTILPDDAMIDNDSDSASDSGTPSP